VNEETAVPAEVVTDTNTAPRTWLGVSTSICEAEFVFIETTEVEPNLTDVAEPKLVPEIVTIVPPLNGPLLTEIPVNVGVPIGVAVALDVVVPPNPLLVTRSVMVTATPFVNGEIVKFPAVVRPVELNVPEPIW
jgi:hypothetical protein